MQADWEAVYSREIGYKLGYKYTGIESPHLLAQPNRLFMALTTRACSHLAIRSSSCLY
jgi:hypothetical protein